MNTGVPDLMNLAEPNVPLVAVWGSGLVVTCIGSLHDAVAISSITENSSFFIQDVLRMTTFFP